MLTGICLLLINQTADITPGQAVSKMLAYYSKSAATAGEIEFNVVVGDVSVKTLTKFQFEEPSMLFIRQYRAAGKGERQAIVTSDGKNFSYDHPQSLNNPQGVKRLFERVKLGDVVMNCKAIYGATVDSLLDRAPYLDICIGRTEDLKYMRNQWASLNYLDVEHAEGSYVVGGDWREYGEAEPSAKYQMWISKDFQLEKYMITESVRDDAGNIHTVVSTWKGKVQIDAKTDKALYKVIK